MAHEKQHTVEVLEPLHTDRFDYLCDEEEELELQAKDIIIYFNNKEGSSADTKVDSNVNQQDVSSSGLDIPNNCSASDSATKGCLNMPKTDNSLICLFLRA